MVENKKNLELLSYFAVIFILLFGVQFLLSDSAFASSAEASRCKFAIDDAYQECSSGKGFMCGKLTATIPHRCYVPSLQPYWCEIGTHYKRVACMNGQGFNCGEAGAVARSKCEQSMQ